MPVFDAYRALNVVIGPTRTTAGAGMLLFHSRFLLWILKMIHWILAGVNQANEPVYRNITVSAESITTSIPPGIGGLAFAVLTDQNSALDVECLTAATVAGPAVVQIFEGV